MVREAPIGNQGGKTTTFSLCGRAKRTAFSFASAYSATQVRSMPRAGEGVVPPVAQGVELGLV